MADPLAFTVRDHPDTRMQLLNRIRLIAQGALQAASNLADLKDKTASRANLGLGTAATQPTSAFATAFLGVLPQIGDYTLGLSNNGQIQWLNTAAGHTITADATPATGFSCPIFNTGAGTWTFACAGGVYKDGATVTGASALIPAGARCFAYHLGGGKWVLRGV